MKVVVGGANGLIGKALVAQLRARGDEVVALVRHKGDEAWAKGAKVVQWDGKTQGDWSREVDGADAVVNLAGAPVAGKRWSDAWKKVILDSRVDSASAFVQAIRAARTKPRVFAAGSAIGYYGLRGDSVLEENSSPGDDFLAKVCVAWEAASAEAEAAGVRTVLLRTGVVLAREGGALEQMLPPFKAFVGGPIGDGKQWFSWIHIDDEIGLILHSIDKDVRGALNLVAPEPVPAREFSKALGKALHRPSWLPVPGFSLRILLGEFASMLTGSQRVLPAVANQTGYQFRFKTIGPALEDLLGATARKPAVAAAEAR